MALEVPVALGAHAAETILASNYTQLHPKAEHMHARSDQTIFYLNSCKREPSTYAR